MSQENWMWAIMAMIVFIPALVLIFPVATYIVSVWRLRQREILVCISQESLKWYFKIFYPAELRVNGVDLNIKTLERQFSRLYTASFGRSKFVLPATLLLAITTVLSLFTAHGIKPYLPPFLGMSDSSSASSYALLGFAGFAGGYMWVLLYLMKRMQERQLTPFDLYAGCARIVLCIPVALALTAFFKGTFQDHALVALAFMLGAFPTNTLITFMRRTAASKLNLEQSFDDQATNLIQLQGIERNEAEAFSKEGVCTILQLAYSDPVDITIRTGFSFSYVVDCCSQALAWLYFETDMQKLRRFSLRSAHEICTLVRELSRDTNQDETIMDEEQQWAEKTMDAVAKELNIDKTVLRRTFDEVAFDPYTQFLYNVWQSACY